MADNDDLTADFRERLRGRLWGDKSSVAYVPERDDPIFEAMDTATEVFAEMAGDLRNTPVLHAGDTVEVWEEHSPRQAPIRRGTVKAIGNSTGPLIVVLEEQATS